MPTVRRFNPLILVIGVLVLIIIAGVGYAVLSSKKASTNKATSSSNDDTSQATVPDNSDRWYQYSSPQGEYKIRLADGLIFTNAAQGGYASIYTHNLTTTDGVKAKVVNGSGAAETTPYGLTISYADSSQATAQGDKQISFNTKSGLNVDEYFYVQRSTPDGSGLDTGDSEYTFIITKDTKAVVLTYDLSSKDPGNITLISQMAKTVELN